jgi:hypothetical protein
MEGLNSVSFNVLAKVGMLIALGFICINHVINGRSLKSGLVKLGISFAIFAIICVYDMQDHKRKEKGNILWQIFPEKEQDGVDETPIQNKLVTSDSS